jgi:sialidase-1
MPRANPDAVETAENLAAQLSEDDGATWTHKRVIDAGWAGYADISVGPDGIIHVIYERGGLGDDHFRTAFLTLASFDLEWLTEGAATLESKQ